MKKFAVIMLGLMLATGCEENTVQLPEDTSGSDVVLNPGWFARSTAEQADDLVIIDLG